MRNLILGLLVGITYGCGGAAPVQMSEVERAAVVDSATALAEELAAAITARDGGQVAALFADGEFVKYVSDGFVISGEALQATVDRYYGSVEGMDFRWDRQEVHVLGPHAAILTSWASYTEMGQNGETKTEKAIYTSVIEQGERGWRFVTSHKSFIP